MASNQKYYHITVKSTTENLAAIRDFVKDAAVDCGCDNSTIDKVILAVDEASTNIIKYAYNYRSDKDIEVKVKFDNDNFIVEIIDNGNSFNPANYKEPDLEKYVKEKRVGGLGIFLIKKCCDEVKYEILKNKTNKVTLLKKIK